MSEVQSTSAVPRSEPGTGQMCFSEDAEDNVAEVRNRLHLEAVSYTPACRCHPTDADCL